MENTPKTRGLRKYILGGMAAALVFGAIGITGAVHANGFRAPGFGPFSDFRLERALKSVDATGDQREKIWTIVDIARTEIRPMMRGINDQREALESLLTADTLDRAAVEALRKQTLANADAISARATKALLDAAEVLTPGQRTELLERRHQFRPGFGPGKD